jgi:hypothetical protein
MSKEYSIELQKAGQFLYDSRDRNLERAVVFLVERIGIENWRSRRDDIAKRHRERRMPNSSSPIEGVSIRDTVDEFGWYLYLAEQSIADPPSIDSDQSARVLPYLSALGRKLDSISSIQGVDIRLDRLVRVEKQRDPDQAIFELLVGATYAEEGWAVVALPDGGSTKQPDFQVSKGDLQFLVECKRLTRRSDYSSRERDAWLALWHPASEWLVENRVSIVWTIVLHQEIHTYPKEFLLEIVKSYVLGGDKRNVLVDDVRCRISAAPVDYEGIARVLEDNYVKHSSSRERELITGEHTPEFGLTYSVAGVPIAMGDSVAGSNLYWESISFVSVARWRCDADGARNAKARSILKRLSEANDQLSSSILGIVHIGIETADGDDVEVARMQKIDQALNFFDAKGKALAWVFLHFFRGESPPDQMWAVDETTKVFQRLPVPKPLNSHLMLGDESVPTYPRAHWDP